jgi:hypothetical protein
VIAACDCKLLAEQAEEYLEGKLANGDAEAIREHLRECQACRETLSCLREIHGMVDYIEAKTETPLVAEQTEAVRVSPFDRLGAAPWWFVSVSVHILLIALAGLVTMAIEMPQNNDNVVMITELQQRVTIKDDQPPEQKPALQDVLSKNETPPTDLDSKVLSNISVPPDILAKAEQGDHFETIDLDRPDTHSAYGTEESRSFHSVEGNAEPAGGGGTGGLGMDDLIGFGGAASKGTGGGFGGGNGTGIGTGDGCGKGSFGNRNGGGRKLMVLRHGGTKESEGAVDRGLAWLARNQDADGHWDAQKFGAETKADGREARVNVDTACTGFALLAFLGAGHTEKVGKYKDNVIRGLKYLKTHQEYDSGMYCKWNYGHAIAGMAMAEAAGMGRMQDTVESAQKAVDATCALQVKHLTSDRGGWSYYPPQLGRIDGDISNSGWAAMFLKSAKVAGLKIPAETVQGIHDYFNALEIGRVKDDPYSGCGYGYQPNPANMNDQNVHCAIGTLVNLFFGRPPNEVEGCVKHMLDLGGLPSPKIQNDLYYTYYGTLIAFQVGGQTWKDWNNALLQALPPNQVKGADDDGSWEYKNHGRWGNTWGRVGETALSILCMEVYYRYQRISQ